MGHLLNSAQRRLLHDVSHTFPRNVALSGAEKGQEAPESSGIRAWIALYSRNHRGSFVTLLDIDDSRYLRHRHREPDRSQIHGRQLPGANKINNPRMIITAAPTGLAYLAYRTPRFEVKASAADPKITRLSNMKKNTYRRM